MILSHFVFTFWAVCGVNGFMVARRQSVTVGTNPSNDKNINRHSPSTPIYPKKSENDGTFDLPEHKLRQAIYIPPTFTFGTKTPILVRTSIIWLRLDQKAVEKMQGSIFNISLTYNNFS
jgi:hypothetical protein